jgi:hypothetical protein
LGDIFKGSGFRIQGAELQILAEYHSQKMGFERSFVSKGGTGFQPVKQHGQDERATWALTQKSELSLFCFI